MLQRKKTPRTSSSGLRKRAIPITMSRSSQHPAPWFKLHPYYLAYVFWAVAID
jgi:hypothetical protein